MLSFILLFPKNQTFDQETSCKTWSDCPNMFRAFPLGITCEGTLLEDIR